MEKPCDKCNKKANRSLNAIKLIRKYFNSNELLALTTSNFYSVLFYNSEVWLSGYLNDSVKHKLFVASANALKMCRHYCDQSISFIELHKNTKRVTPMMLSEYKCALQLFKTFNECLPINEHSLCSRFYQLNGKIPQEWLGKSYSCYKILCKHHFLSLNNVN
jgi:hypothetical protein